MIRVVSGFCFRGGCGVFRVVVGLSEMVLDMVFYVFGDNLYYGNMKVGYSVDDG